jgi:hypothetical protein
LSAFARKAATTAVFPSANAPGGLGITMSDANMAVSPETRSVFALAAENARSAASSSSTAACGVGAAAHNTGRTRPTSVRRIRRRVRGLITR